MLRYVGNIEKISTVNHFHGFFRCVSITAKYSTDLHTRNIAPLIEGALATVILEHPVLCVGITGEETEKPAFVRLDTIDISKCVEYRDVIAFTVQEYNGILESILDNQHSLLWQEISNHPPWKVIVVQSTARSYNKMTVDIIFSYHHALADGMSGLIFHRSLLAALESSPIVENPPWYIKVPKNLKLGLPLEQRLNFSVSFPFFVRTLVSYVKPSWISCKKTPWTGNPCSQKQVQNWKPRSKILTIGAYQLALVLAACRRQECTLTGLLYGIIVVSLTSHIPQAKGLQAGVPYSLRYLLDKTTRDEMACLAWGTSVPYSARTISNIRSNITDARITNDMWTIAREFSVSLSKDLGTLPRDNLIGLLPRLRSTHKAFTSRMGLPRSESFEVSNLGVFRNPPEDAKWRIEKMILSQSGNAIGPAIGFNVVTVDGGPLTVCATWLEGAIGENLVNLVCDDILQDLTSVSRSVDHLHDVQHPGNVSL